MVQRIVSFSAALVVVGVAGCASPGGAPALPDYQSVTVAVSEDDYEAIGIEAVAASRLEVAIAFTDNVVAFDLLVLHEQAMNQWVNGGGLNTYADCAWVVSADTAENLECDLASGSYFVVVENGDEGDVDPPRNGLNDKVHVQVSTWLTVQ